LQQHEDHLQSSTRIHRTGRSAPGAGREARGVAVLIANVLDEEDLTVLLGDLRLESHTKNSEAQVRQYVDGNDSFMTGFLVGSARQYKRVVPRWVHNDAEIQKILMSAFPKLKTDSRQRQQAARWFSVIHFYFRLRYTAAQTAEELSLKLSTVNETVRSIKRVAEGRRANGKLRAGRRGRPKGVGKTLHFPLPA